MVNKNHNPMYCPEKKMLKTESWSLKLGRYYLLSPLIYIHSPRHIHLLLIALMDKHHNCSVGVLRVVGILICLTYLLMVVNMLDIFCVLDSLLLLQVNYSHNFHNNTIGTSFYRYEKTSRG